MPFPLIRYGRHAISEAEIAVSEYVFSLRPPSQRPAFLAYEHVMAALVPERRVHVVNRVPETCSWTGCFWPLPPNIVSS